MTFLEKLHYSVLKEIHFQHYIINRVDVPEPDTKQIITIIDARTALAKLEKQEHRIRVRLSKNKKL